MDRTLDSITKLPNIQKNRIRFSKEKRASDFYSVLKQRVSDHLKENKRSFRDNLRIAIRSGLLLGAVVAIYVGLLLPSETGKQLAFAFSLLGIFCAISSMNVLHDALHGSLSSIRSLNRVIGFVMDLYGGSSYFWRKAHTVDHHTFTNIAEEDADLKVPLILRICPSAPYNPYHRFQFIYAPFLYAMNLFHWVWISDFKRFYRILAKKERNQPPLGEVVAMFSLKFLHIGLYLVAPYLLSKLPFWKIGLCYCCYLAVTGFVLTVIFQLAHIVEGVEFPLPDQEGLMENNLAEHQIKTTSNFGTKSWLTTFLTGGLNHQIEHHLFPHIPNIYLTEISAIVKKTAYEFGLPYQELPSFWTALRSHFSLLKKLGRA